MGLSDTTLGSREDAMARMFGNALRALVATFIVGLLGLSGASAQNNPIKIGMSLALTGAGASPSKVINTALELWRDDVNAKGGLLGRPVELVIYDDQSTPANVPGIYTKLITVDKVDLLLGPYGTNFVAPALPTIIQNKKMTISFTAIGINDKFHYDKYFSMVSTGPEGVNAFSIGFFDLAAAQKPKPQTVAILAADAEFAQSAAQGAREEIKKHGFKLVYDKSYPPNTVDFAPVVRAIQAVNPAVVFVASYPPDSVGMVRAANEIGLKPKMFGGGMIGLAFTPIKLQLGHLLNGIVAYDVYEPESTMKFPGVDEFLKRYQEKAAAQGVDPLGYYLPPFAYSEMQILAEAVTQVGSLDQDKIAAYIHKTTFHTIVGDVAFAPNGEWAKSRVLFVQYRDIKDNDLEQFRQGGKTPILYPPEYKTGDLVYPYSEIKR